MTTRLNGFVEKGWGSELIWATNDKYCGKLLKFNAGAKFSMHFHSEKDETWYVLDGKLPPDFPKYQLNNRRLRLDPYLRVIYNDYLIRYVQNSKLKEIAKNLKHDYNI